jgi:hypothetical protein
LQPGCVPRYSRRMKTRLHSSFLAFVSLLLARPLLRVAR